MTRVSEGISTDTYDISLNTDPSGEVTILVAADAESDNLRVDETDDEVGRFFRFFGDHDGDRDVDASNLSAFGLSFREPAVNPWFDPRCDANGESRVDVGDLIQFGHRLRQSMPFS